MKYFALIIFLSSFSVNAEFEKNLEMTKLAKEAIASVRIYLGEKHHNLVLNDIDLEFSAPEGTDVLEFKDSLNEKSVLQFWIVDVDDTKELKGCLAYVQYIAKLELDKRSTFHIDIGEFRDCTDDRLPPNNMLK